MCSTRRSRCGRGSLIVVSHDVALLNLMDATAELRDESLAQVSAGKLRGQLDASVAAAKDTVAEQEQRIRRDPGIAIALPDPGVPAGRRLAELRDSHGHGFLIAGRERVALTGRNGIGKTRLLQQLVQSERGESHDCTASPFTDRIGYLPQRLDHLDDAATLLDTVRSAAPGIHDGDLRGGLARFLFRGDVIHRCVADLSGGERFRIALAALLLADPPNQLLVLDEPTNNLDLHSVDELVEALSAYHGGLIVVSHDDVFLNRLRIDTWIAMDDSGLHHGTPATPRTNGSR